MTLREKAEFDNIRAGKFDEPTITPKKSAKKISSKWEESMADRLKTWAQKPESFMIEEFITAEDILPRTFYEGVHSNEKLSNAHEFALMRCGVNKEKWAIKGREGLHTANVAMLYHYMDRWAQDRKHKEAREDKKNLGIKEALGNITIVDHMLEKDV